MAAIQIFTVGHSQRTAEGLIALLRAAGVQQVADVRRYPGSKRYPQFRREALDRALGEAGLGYRHFPEVGGFRRPDEASPHRALDNPGFRGYADHMSSAEFRKGYTTLEAWAQEHPTALLCAEADPQHCHRRFLSDRFQVAGHRVTHLLQPGEQVDHRLSESARVEADGRIVYDAGTLPF